MHVKKNLHFIPSKFLFIFLITFMMLKISCKIELNKHYCSYYPTGQILSESFSLANLNINLTYFYYKSGKLKSTLLFKDQLLNGRQYTYFQSGKKHSEKEFKNGALNGFVKYYYLSGKLISVENYKNGIFIFPSTNYYESGKISSIIKGNIDRFSVEEYYETGELLARIIFKNKFNYESVEFYNRNGNLINGSRTIFYESGKLKIKSRFNNGKPDGLLSEFFESGTISVEIHYKNGIPHGLKREYCENGLLETEIPYVSGKIHGMIKIYNIFYDNNVKTLKFKDGEFIGVKSQ